MYPFLISSDAKGVASFKFYLKSQTEIAQLMEKITETKKIKIEESRLRKSMHDPAAVRSMLMQSERYKKDNQLSGGLEDLL
jgi:hypothetical protein